MERPLDLSQVERSLVESMADAGALPGRPHIRCSSLLDVAFDSHELERSTAFEAMVALSSVGTLSVPLVDEHGNFGGPGYGPAEPQYLEARLSLAGYLAATSTVARKVVALVNGDEHVGGQHGGHAPALVLDLVETRLGPFGADRIGAGAVEDADLWTSIDEIVRTHADELSEGGLGLLRTALKPGRHRR